MNENLHTGSTMTRHFCTTFFLLSAAFLIFSCGKTSTSGSTAPSGNPDLTSTDQNLRTCVNITARDDNTEIYGAGVDEKNHILTYAHKGDRIARYSKLTSDGRTYVLVKFKDKEFQVGTVETKKFEDPCPAGAFDAYNVEKETIFAEAVANGELAGIQCKLTKDWVLKFDDVALDAEQRDFMKFNLSKSIPGCPLTTGYVSNKILKFEIFANPDATGVEPEATLFDHFKASLKNSARS